jgi:hypothetical protein
MAQRTNGVSAAHKGSSARQAAEEALRLEERADMLRADLDGVVEELDRRRHAAVRRLKPVALAAAGVAVAGGAGLIAWRIHVRRTRPKLTPFAEAVQRMRAHPERLAKDSPSVGHKVAAAVLTTLASLIVRRLFTSAVSNRRR